MEAHTIKTIVSMLFFVLSTEGQQDITNFHVVNTYLNIVELSWDSFINATLYQVSGYDLKTYTVVNSTTNATTVKNLKMNTDYYFKVNVLELNNLTINKIMISSRLILVNAKTNMFSDKINFTATNATYNSILLNWYPFKAVILYKVEYSINGSVNETQNVMTSNSSIELTNLISNKTYRMKLFVVAINGIISEDQLQSNDLLYSTLKEKAKFEVLMLNLTAGMITSESIFVTWTSFEDATQFQVMCVTNTTRGTPLYLTTNSTFLNITNLQSGTQYEITVYVSEILNTIPTITKKSLTLTTKTREPWPSTWATAMVDPGTSWSQIGLYNISDDSRVCPLHFDASCFDKSNEQLIKSSIGGDIKKKEISKKSDVSKKNNSENRFLYSKLTIPVFAIVAIFFILS